MARVLLAALAALGTLGWSGMAGAQTNGFGSERPFVLSFEHLLGATYTNIKAEGEDADGMFQVGTFLNYSFLSPGSQGRLGLHYFPSPSFSVGALLSYADNDNLGTQWLAGGRIGFATPMSDTSSLWVRVGAHYARNEFDFGIGEVTTSAIVPGGEILFVFEPVEHFGVMLGPMFEYGFGKQKAESSFMGTSASNEEDFSYWETGLTVGFFTAW